MIFPDNSPSSKDLFLNTYLDTGNGYLSNSQLCEQNPVTNNCNDLVKFHDGTTFNMFPGTYAKLDDDDKKCIKMKSSSHGYKLETEHCSAEKRMVCLLDCCKLFYYEPF